MSIIQVANMGITYCPVRLSSRRVGEGLKGVDGDVILDSFKFTILEHMMIWCKFQEILSPLS